MSRSPWTLALPEGFRCSSTSQTPISGDNVSCSLKPEPQSTEDFPSVDCIHVVAKRPMVRFGLTSPRSSAKMR